MLFEISATESVGVFDVSAKFMGVPMEKVELIFQVRYTIFLIFYMGFRVISTCFSSGLENRKNERPFSSQEKVQEFLSDWKSQGILSKILEK